MTEQEKIREGIAEFHYYFPNGEKRTEGRWDALSDDERKPYLHTAKLQVQYLHSQGVVIKAEMESDLNTLLTIEGQPVKLVESLMEEG